MGEAEADPWYTTYGLGVHHGVYGHYGGVYGYPYSGVHYGVYGKREAEAKADPYFHYGVYGKREAEAEPKADAEADPAIVNTVPVVSTYGHSIVSTAVKTVVPSVYGHGIYGVGVYGKRDAEADPYVYGFPYTTGFGYAHTPYIGYG